MRKMLLLLAMLISDIFNFGAQQPRHDSGLSPIEILKRFCELDAEGRLLSTEADDETASLLVSPFKWSRNRTVEVVEAYDVHGPDFHANSDLFTVVYRKWGEIDSSLQFTREEGLLPYKPVAYREYFHVVGPKEGSNIRRDLGKGGSGIDLGWRIEPTPLRPRVSIDAAVRYVTREGNESTNPLMKDNAEKTLIVLKFLLRGTPKWLSANLQKTPAAVVQEFCQDDSKGGLLTTAARRDINALFLEPGSLQPNKLIIIKDYGVGSASITDETKAEVDVSYISLGELDPNAVLFQPISGIKTIEHFYLALRGNHSQVRSEEDLRRQSVESRVWKIVGEIQEPHITVATAIHYVTQKYETSTDPVVKKNAEKTLAMLMKMR